MWYKHPIYVIVHIAFGCVSVWIPWFFVCVLAYQYGQYLFNVRVFPLELAVRHGNSIEHTCQKLNEIQLGYTVGKLIQLS
jgi:hypothetical protein